MKHRRIRIPQTGNINSRSLLLRPVKSLNRFQSMAGSLTTESGTENVWEKLSQPTRVKNGHTKTLKDEEFGI
jgi:hypothetical protein